jgi:excinuclease UvrABC helicase subunit UvrB
MEENEEYGESGAMLTPMGFVEDKKTKKKTFEEFEIAPQGSYRDRRKAVKKAQNEEWQAKNKPVQTRRKLQVFANFEDKKEEYTKEIKELELPIPELRDRLQIAVDALDFEMAAALRDVIKEREEG